MTPDDLKYYETRAASERILADQAHGSVAEVHRELARLYQRLVELEQVAQPALIA